MGEGADGECDPPGGAAVARRGDGIGRREVGRDPERLVLGRVDSSRPRAVEHAEAGGRVRQAVAVRAVSSRPARAMSASTAAVSGP